MSYAAPCPAFRHWPPPLASSYFFRICTVAPVMQRSPLDGARQTSPRAEIFALALALEHSAGTVQYLTDHAPLLRRGSVTVTETILRMCEPHAAARGRRTAAAGTVVVQVRAREK